MEKTTNKQPTGIDKKDWATMLVFTILLSLVYVARKL